MANHIVQQQKFDLTLSSKRNAVEEQDRFVRVFQQQVLPQLEQIFDAVAGSERVVSLDSLTVDLGKLPEAYSDADLAESMLLEFTDQLQEVQHLLQNGTGASVANQSTASSNLQALGHFLRTGNLPWWAAQLQAPHHLTADANSLPDANTTSTATTQFQAPQRIAQLIDQLLHNNAAEVLQLILQEAAEPRVRLRLFRQLAAKQLIQLLQLLTKHINLEILTPPSQELAATAQWQSYFPPSASAQLLEATSKLEVALVLHLNANPLVSTSQLMAAKAANPKAKNQVLAEQERQSKNNLKQLQQTANSDQQRQGKAMYSTNAGMVMLWPFLEMYFTDLGLLQHQAWKNEQAQERAALLLQLLATGTPQAEEHLLPLNKILVGLPLDHPLPAEIQPTDLEQQKSEAVLNSITAHWKPMNGTTPAQLQHSFLMREGRLTPKPDGWELIVEQKGYDIVLDSLPWGIGTILLPWLSDQITVQWA